MDRDVYNLMQNKPDRSLHHCVQTLASIVTCVALVILAACSCCDKKPSCPCCPGCGHHCPCVPRHLEQTSDNGQPDLSPSTGFGEGAGCRCYCCPDCTAACQWSAK